MTQKEAIKVLNGYMGGKIDPESTELYQAIELVVDILESQPSLPSSLDKAAEEYGRNTFINECMDNGVCDDHDLSDAFIAGADWQKEQDQETIELAEDHAMLAGRMQMKEQMMKDAMDAIVENWNSDPEPEITIPLNPEEFTCGDKVRVIIIKEEG